jgi:hypothetical protein
MLLLLSKRSKAVEGKIIVCSCNLQFFNLGRSSSPCPKKKRVMLFLKA